MNKKMFLVLGIVLGLILVPLVAATPSFAQSIAGNGDTLRTQDQQQLQTRDCTNDCVSDLAVTPLQTQTQDQLQTQNQTQQCQQTCDCNANGDNCNGTQLQTQTRHRECLQQQSAIGGNASLGQNNYCYNYQHQLRYRNQAP